MSEQPYCWDNIFRKMVSETDPIRFDEEVREVEEALWNRCQELVSSGEQGAEERAAIEDASATIVKLKNKRILSKLS